jgi:hypothetical protein
MGRNMGVIYSGVAVNVTSMDNPQKAKRIQADEDRGKQQPLRNGFMAIHEQPYSAVYLRLCRSQTMLRNKFVGAYQDAQNRSITTFSLNSRLSTNIRADDSAPGQTTSDHFPTDLELGCLMPNAGSGLACRNAVFRADHRKSSDAQRSVCQPSTDLSGVCG